MAVSCGVQPAQLRTIGQVTVVPHFHQDGPLSFNPQWFISHQPLLLFQHPYPFTDPDQLRIFGEIQSLGSLLISISQP